MADKGHVKRNTATGAVAVRTQHPADDPILGKRAWQVATVNIGAKVLTDAEIQADSDWVDLFIPEPEESGS